jgi:DinB superfamily
MNDPNTVIAALENAPSIILSLVQEFPPEILKRRPEPGKWSAHEHACHLATVHPLMFSRLDLMLSETSPYIKPHLPDVDDEDDALLKLDLGEAMQRFVHDRQWLIERLQGLSAKEWQRTADHGEYSRYSVFIMFRHLAMHDMLHAYRIEELLLKKDWL